MTFIELREQIVLLINSVANSLSAAEIHGVITSIEVETRNQILLGLGKPRNKETNELA